ncbi:MAG TPA: hypothetical protein VFL14_09300 [Xanthomonadales bacterium]|nr:hypothetical protein [Xanthomonadales bacterium]
MRGSPLVNAAGASIALLLVGAATPVHAISPLMQIEQIYSNASGTVQFIVVVDGGSSDCDSAEERWTGQRLVSTGPAGTTTFTFQNDLPTCRTSGRSILIASEGFAALGLVTPDFVIPNDFVPRPAGTVRLGTVSQQTYTNLPTDGVRAINAVNTPVQNVATNLAGASASVVPATGVELNQHGLTGAWFEPATTGQGFGVEMFADPASGSGLAFVTWFTYDTTVGGADRQRWYAAQGVMNTGQPTAQLTIYRNIDGNFDAPPVTTSQPVGNATLSFDTCSSGTLTYAFMDGSNRSGTIPLTRLIQNVTCSTTGASSPDADYALSGNWYAPATSGQGFTVDANPLAGVFFATWYTYVPTGANLGAASQRWYSAQASFARGARTIPVTIFETVGGQFDTPTTTAPTTTAVGTGTWTYQGCTAATFAYAFTGGTSIGRTGTITLARVGPLPPGCAQ